MTESTKALPEDVRKKFSEEAERRHKTAGKRRENEPQNRAFRLGATFGYDSRNEEVERLKEHAPKWIDLSVELPKLRRKVDASIRVLVKAEGVSDMSIMQFVIFYEGGEPCYYWYSDEQFTDFSVPLIPGEDIMPTHFMYLENLNP